MGVIYVEASEGDRSILRDVFHQQVTEGHDKVESATGNKQDPPGEWESMDRLKSPKMYQGKE